MYRTSENCAVKHMCEVRIPSLKNGNIHNHKGTI